MRYADRVKETTTTTGTGTLSLAGAESKFQSFVDAVGDGSRVAYVIVHQESNEWEVGEGVVTNGSPDTLTRETVRSSSNSGELVDFSEGFKDVALVAHAKTMNDLFLLAWMGL